MSLCRYQNVEVIEGLSDRILSDSITLQKSENIYILEVVIQQVVALYLEGFSLVKEEFSVEKKTASAYHKKYPQFQIVHDKFASNDKIYYVWTEYDEEWMNQIWTAESNLDGTEFIATKQTASDYDKEAPQLHVIGDKIYYVWSENDGSYKNQIWTATSNLDGTEFTANKKTTSGFHKYFPQLQVVNDKVYYIWNEIDTESNKQLWVMELDIYGVIINIIQYTITGYNKTYQEFQVVKDKIYQIWTEYDGTHNQIWTANMNIDTSGFIATKQTASAHDKTTGKLHVIGDKIYYVWTENEGGYKFQIWTATSNLDGTGFIATKQTIGGQTKYYPQLHVTSEEIFYAWHEHDGSNYQIWTAESNLDGTEFIATKRTTSASDRYEPKFEVFLDRIYYIWEEDDGENHQIWTAERKGL